METPRPIHTVSRWAIEVERDFRAKSESIPPEGDFRAKSESIPPKGKSVRTISSLYANRNRRIGKWQKWKKPM